ncbi:hypothetical protein SeMB42_g06420 [Synchytrium endobioticum]|uniref:Thioredoxin domain-containing protein n=1 Tax=Synchytrium endobioticum TaxID=286115 RepID=A0A507CIZ3_9FUNG|nr:hypothetical protein SeMB42_g06420 [Synchytrium endobioticum]TPX39581.1 hypothetical protein SeLEV6574_g07115 [Synchytrium endobioticum]
MTITHISSLSQFNSKISESKLTVTKFTAVWCGPCKAVAPRFEALANQTTNVNFLEVDVDQQKDVAASSGIRAMPTFVFHKNGKKLAEVVGADIAKVERLTSQYGSPSTFTGSGHVLGGNSAAKSNASASSPRSSSFPLSMDTNTIIMIALALGLIAYYWFNPVDNSDVL